MNDAAPKRSDAYAAIAGLKGRAIVMSDVHDLIDKMADDLLGKAIERFREAGVFHIALSGGSTPKILFRQLMTDPTYRVIDWSRTHVWIVDERCVGADDNRRNYKMIRELLIDHIPITADHVHPMPVDQQSGDQQYDTDLRATIGPIDNAGVPRLDYVLLGMGGDGHTASLFPHTPALSVRDRLVTFNDGDTVAEPRPRMTMTYPLINAARTIAPLVTGSAKHAMLQRVAAAGASTNHIDDLPITGIQPTSEDGELIWYLDDAAALGD